MSLSFKNLIRQRSALVYVDDILLISNSERYMLQLMEQLHDAAKKGYPKITPEKIFFLPLSLKNIFVMKLAVIQLKYLNPKLVQFINFLLRLHKSKG